MLFVFVDRGDTKADMSAGPRSRHALPSSSDDDEENEVTKAGTDEEDVDDLRSDHDTVHRMAKLARRNNKLHAKQVAREDAAMGIEVNKLVAGVRTPTVAEVKKLRLKDGLGKKGERRNKRKRDKRDSSDVDGDEEDGDDSYEQDEEDEERGSSEEDEVTGEEDSDSSEDSGEEESRLTRGTKKRKKRKDKKKKKKEKKQKKKEKKKHKAEKRTTVDLAGESGGEEEEVQVVKVSKKKKNEDNVTVSAIELMAERFPASRFSSILIKCGEGQERSGRVSIQATYVTETEEEFETLEKLILGGSSGGNSSKTLEVKRPIPSIGSQPSSSSSPPSITKLRTPTKTPTSGLSSPPPPPVVQPSLQRGYSYSEVPEDSLSCHDLPPSFGLGNGLEKVNHVGTEGESEPGNNAGNSQPSQPLSQDLGWRTSARRKGSIREINPELDVPTVGTTITPLTTTPVTPSPVPKKATPPLVTPAKESNEVKAFREAETDGDEEGDEEDDDEVKDVTVTVTPAKQTPTKSPVANKPALVPLKSPPPPPKAVPLRTETKNNTPSKAVPVPVAATPQAAPVQQQQQPSPSRQVDEKELWSKIEAKRKRLFSIVRDNILVSVKGDTKSLVQAVVEAQKEIPNVEVALDRTKKKLPIYPHLIFVLFCCNEKFREQLVALLEKEMQVAITSGQSGSGLTQGEVEKFKSVSSQLREDWKAQMRARFTPDLASPKLVQASKLLNMFGDANLSQRVENLITGWSKDSVVEPQELGFLAYIMDDDVFNGCKNYVMAKKAP